VFNIGSSEFMVIALMALLVLGPERMPDLVRKAGRLVAEVRRMSSGFQAEMRDAFGEPMDAVNDLKNQMNSTVNDLRSSITNAVNIDDKPVSAPMAPVPDPGPVASDDSVALQQESIFELSVRKEAEAAAAAAATPTQGGGTGFDGAFVSWAAPPAELLHPDLAEPDSSVIAAPLARPAPVEPAEVEQAAAAGEQGPVADGVDAHEVDENVGP
jgi:sec-independent protein translocase protein TatB